MITRRRFIEAGAVAGVGAMLPVKVAKAAENAARTRNAGAMAAAAVAAPVGVSPAFLKYESILPLVGSGISLFPQTGFAADGVTPHYDVQAAAFTHLFHSGNTVAGPLPTWAPTPVWGYQPLGTPLGTGSLFSHAMLAYVGQPVEMAYHNALLPTDVHPVEAGATPGFPVIDTLNIGGMKDAAGFVWPFQRISVHLHGGHVPSTSDGGPMMWYTGPYFSPTAPYGQGSGVVVDGMYNGNTYFYPNDQPGSLLWFHDHAMGITRLNVYAGLAAPYILVDPREATLLPQFQVAPGHEIPLVIQDRIFNPNGTLFYPPAPAVPEFFGDTFVVNGKVWPVTTVDATKYRIRLLNGCNARFLRMQFVKAVVPAAGGTPTLPSVRNWVNLPFTQIGAEGGYFTTPQPSPVGNVLLMAPAERADIIVDFSAVGPAGGNVILYNDAATPFSNTTDTRGAIPEVMLFRVNPTPTPPPITVTLPPTFAPLGGFVDTAGAEVITQAEITAALTAMVGPTPPASTFKVKVLTEVKLANGMLMQLITGDNNQTGYEYDPVTGLHPFTGKAPGTDTAPLNTLQVWQIVNATVDTHPIHLHQTMFKVIGRYKFGTSQYLFKSTTKAGVTYGNPMPFVKGAMIPAGPDEQGWKDTVRANPDELTIIAMKFISQGGPHAQVGEYVYHCHILEHEEHDMMRRLVVG